MLKIKGSVVVAGDWHGNPQHVREVIEYLTIHHPQVRTILHAGDMNFWNLEVLTQYEDDLARAALMLYWVDGNHENHPLVRSLPRDEEGFGYVSEHVRHIPRATLFMVNDRRWLGLGGTFTVNRASRPVSFRIWSQGESISREDAIKATSYGWADVVLSHEAPFGIPAVEDPINAVSSSSNYPEWEVAESKAQRRLMREIVEYLQPDTIYHGHHHLRHSSNLLLNSGKMVKVEGLDRDGKNLLDNFIITE